MPVVVSEAKGLDVAEAWAVPTYASTSNATLDVVERVVAHRSAILAEPAIGVQAASECTSMLRARRIARSRARRQHEALDIVGDRSTKWRHDLDRPDSGEFRMALQRVLGQSLE